MSWRDILGVTATATSPTHNPQNSHNTTLAGDSAYCADTAQGCSEDHASKLLEALTECCRDIEISALEVKEKLKEHDIADWQSGRLSTHDLTALARSLVHQRIRESGQRPEHYTAVATCNQCGPIWLDTPGTVAGCPWCLNRVSESPIPRPCLVHCCECAYFKRIDHPHLGHCLAEQPEALVGLWDTDARHCERFIPIPRQTREGLKDVTTSEQKRFFQDDFGKIKENIWAD